MESYYIIRAETIQCLICDKFVPLLNGGRKYTHDTFMNHLVTHTNASPTSTSAGLMVVSGDPFSYRYGFLYFARIFPVLTLVRFVNMDLELSKIAKLYNSYPEHNYYTEGSMFNLASNEYFDDSHVNMKFVMKCRRIIMESDYCCGKCGMEYESGIPTLEIAWMHFVVTHFDYSCLLCGMYYDSGIPDVKIFFSHMSKCINASL